MSSSNPSLVSGFVRSLLRDPDQIALQIGDDTWTYGQLWRLASRFGAVVREFSEASDRVVSILAGRSVNAYAGILGILASGRGYVPLNPKFPIERTLAMLKASGCRTLIVGQECSETLESLIPLLGTDTTCVVSGGRSQLPVNDLQQRHQMLAIEEITSHLEIAEPATRGDDTAYLLFTSGSTGIPKGVPVNQSNVCSYLEYVGRRYKFNSGDRFSQNFDLTFDLSVHDLFACWGAGATLCCWPEQTLVPATTIDEYKLTAWFSVPSVGMFASKLGLLSPGAFPSLRVSLFCGEALPATLAENWQRAAPSSIVENLYGPTEATIAITHYRWDRDGSPKECLNGIVPIGWVFDGQQSCVVDDELHPVPAGKTGELCLAGSQVTGGYLNSAERTAAQFIRILSEDDRAWYRTGDLARQDERGCLYYLGRTDQQVKVNGYRVELQEIDLVLREAAGTELAVAVPLTVSNATVNGIVAVLCGTDSSVDAKVFELCMQRLPRYMVPTAIYHFDKLPLNANGKIDRRQIAQQLGRKHPARAA